MERYVLQQKIKTSLVIFLNETSSFNKKAYMKQLKRILPFQQPKTSARLQTIPEDSVQAMGYKCNKRKSDTCDNFQPCCSAMLLLRFIYFNRTMFVCKNSNRLILVQQLSSTTMAPTHCHYHSPNIIICLQEI